MTGYPLAAVLELRAAAETRARVALAAALAAEAAAHVERSRLMALAEDHGTRLRLGARALADAEPTGTLPARSRWAERLRREATAMASALSAAERVEAEARDLADVRRADLAVARADSAALERHRERWRVERARHRERRDEEAAEDHVSARRAAP